MSEYPEMFPFIFIFFLTNIIFSLIIGSVFVRLANQGLYSRAEIFLYSLGLGPIITSLFMYYLLTLWPNQTHTFYLAAIIVLYTVACFIGMSSFFRLKESVQTKIKKNSLREKLIALVLIVFFLYISIFFISSSVKFPLQAYDALQYGTLGDIYFMDNAISFSGYRPYEPNGFYASTTQPPAFPLLLTWGKTIGYVLNYRGDAYFRSTQAYYGLLIVLLQFFWVSKKNVGLAILGFAALMASYAFYMSFFNHHLDTFRIYFVVVSWIFLAYVIKQGDILSILLFGIFSGLAAFTHSIGMVIVVFNIIAFMLFFTGNLTDKLKKALFIVALILAFGGIHYVIDTFWGTGWHFSKTGKMPIQDITKWLK